jgi:hypothetical protein
MTVTCAINLLLVSWPGPYELVRFLEFASIVVVLFVAVRYLKNRK